MQLYTSWKEHGVPNYEYFPIKNQHKNINSRLNPFED